VEINVTLNQCEVRGVRGACRRSILRGWPQSYRKARVLLILVVLVEIPWELGKVVQSGLRVFCDNVGNLKTTQIMRNLSSSYIGIKYVGVRWRSSIRTTCISLQRREFENDTKTAELKYFAYIDCGERAI